MSFLPGEIIGPYSIIEQLGQGGMATVFKAYHAALDRFVALKVLNPAFLQDSNFLTRFRREAKLLGSLEHPNIVPVYDFSEHEGQPFIVMKYIAGETLKARLLRESLRPEEILPIIETVGTALAYAHSQGILHRDIKPSNIILEEHGGIYLADFGFARMVAATNSTITGDMFIGTPQYISPEQAMGSPDLNECTDIYSLGVILFELAVGRVPYDADTPVAVIQHHILSPLPLPRTLNPAVSPRLERVLLKALAKQPHDRYSSVKALVDAFRAAWQEMNAPTKGSTTSMQRANDSPKVLKACLQAVNGQKFILDIGTVTLGRHGERKENPVEVNLSTLDVGKAVSRHHAQIEQRQGEYYLSDLGSTNGTSINGVRLQPHLPAALKNRDVIELGKPGVLLTFILYPATRQEM